MQAETLSQNDVARTDGMTSNAEPAAPGRFWLPVLGAAALCILISCATRHASIAGLVFADTDDHMRLQQVRDWIGGQSWFDVTQYRMNPPTGMLMHWSRLLDVPLAAVILAVRPFAGEHVAEIAACVVIPMLTLGLCLFLLAAIARRQVGPRFALLAVPMGAFNLGSFYALRPMRIDHHGWQIAAGLAIVWALIDRPTIRRAAIAGLAAAFWVHVSLEGIAFTALASGWLGLQWLDRPDEESYRLPAFLGTLAASSLILFSVAHGGALFDRTFCDAASPVHIAIFALAAAGMTLAVRAAPRGMILRAGALGLAAITCGALYQIWAPQCLTGPFATMDPLVYRVWFVSIREGMPLWREPLHDTLLWMPFPLIGLAGGLFGWLRTREADQRRLHLGYLMLMLGAVAVAFTVERAGAFANMLAIPGSLILFRAAQRRISHVRIMPLRATLTAATLIALIPLSSPLLSLLAPQPKSESPAHQARLAQCMANENIARLDVLASATIMTPLNIAPNLITQTHHRVIGSGYHRNGQAIKDVLIFFLASDEAAHAVARRRHIDFVFLCPAEEEMGGDRHFNPNGLAARLADGYPPRWLRPLQVPGLQAAKLYAVIR